MSKILFKSKIVKSAVILTVVLLVTSTFLAYFSISNATETEGWLAGYAYRKHQTIIGSYGAGYDYQLYFKVYRTSGNDSGSTVYLDGKCKPDFSDIRFTDTSQTPTVFPIWKASVSTDYAEFWVKPTTLYLNNNQTIAIYYGNADATDISNGENTFLLFDDFNDGSINTTKWTNVGIGNVYETDGHLHMEANTTTWRPYIRSTDTIGTEVQLFGKALFGNANDTDYGSALLAMICWDGAHSGIYDGEYNTYTGATWQPGVMLTYVNENGVTVTQRSVSVTHTAHVWYNFSVAHSGQTIKSSLAGVAVPDTTDSTPSTYGYVGLAARQGPGGYTEYDDICVRKFVSPEPSHAEWSSSEEVAANIVVYWNTGGSGAIINNKLVTTNGSTVTCYGDVTLAAIIKSSNYLYKNITISNATNTLATYDSNPCSYTLPTETVAVWCYFAPVGGIQPYTNARFTFTQTNSTVNFDGSLSVSNEPILQYLWDFGDSNTATGATVNHTYSSAGIYQVKLTVTSDAGTDSITQTINVG